jgi:hypothetical protein
MAFVKASFVKIFLAVIFFSASFMICLPASLDILRISVKVAGINAVPGKAKPIASDMHCIVLAVPKQHG